MKNDCPRAMWIADSHRRRSVNGRQAMVAADMDWQTASGFDAYTWGDPTTIKRVEIWKMKPTNQGYLHARETRIWQSDTE